MYPIVRFTEEFDDELEDFKYQKKLNRIAKHNQSIRNFDDRLEEEDERSNDTLRYS